MNNRVRPHHFPVVSILLAVAIRLPAGDCNQDGVPDEAELRPAGAGFPYEIGYLSDGSMALGDLDGDDQLDLAVVGFNPGMTGILLNQGAGAFEAKLLGDWLAEDTNSVAVGDLDGDRDLDFAVAVGGPFGGRPRVAVWMNDGSATFTPTAYDVAGEPSWVAAGDLDGDLDLDLAVTSRASNLVSVLLNRGDGTFASPRRSSVGAPQYHVSLGDLDRDGDLDLAGWGDRGWWVLRNQGNGTLLQPAEHYLTDFRLEGLALGDLDGDLDLDVVVVKTLPGQGAVLVNAGDGSFAAGDWFDVGTGPSHVAVGDFDGDADLDLIVPNPNSNTLSLLFNDRAGVFAAPIEFRTSHPGPSFVAVGDLNGDQRLDLAVNGTGVRVLAGLGDGTFAAPLHHTARWSPDSVTAKDLDGDQDIDLAAANSRTTDVSVSLNRGDATFAEEVRYGAASPASPASPGAVTTADFDGDGHFDLAVANEVGGAEGDVAVLRNRGDGTFASAMIYTAGAQPTRIAPADLDGDGHDDLVVVNRGSDDVSLLFNLGDGSFGAAESQTAGIQPSAVATADLDGDQDIDLAVANGGSNDVLLLLNDGRGAFSSAGSLPVGTRPAAVAAADLDGDRHLDLAVANQGSSDVSVLFQQGNAAFAAGVAYPVGAEPRELAVGDIDGDQRLDLTVLTLTIQTGDREPSLWLLFQGDGGSFSRSVSYPTWAYQSLAMADLDGDRHLDLALAGEKLEHLAILLNTAAVSPLDCNGNSIPDACDIASGAAMDCNENGIPDTCDMERGAVRDEDSNLIPDECEVGRQLPSDANQDARVDLSDAVWLLGHLFLGTNPALPCEGGTASEPGPGERRLLDGNGDGTIDLSDAVSLLSWLFLGGSPPTLGAGCVVTPGCPNRCDG